ncbi:alpha/beta hydrolase [Nakamurella sp. YIM 132087]|uniref:Alpha/beta hydrolase n=1 Tax=Nakamurella alba TaxID=2665158 RepID=A0A7K1FTP2_9ACTN|nr:alpha/beta hydrolase [Nakamurella alba]MTD17488.1 alpha/beta hydrolase [Nakamurella alba]
MVWSPPAPHRRRPIVGYTYPIEAQSMFDDREHQFASFGLSVADIARVRRATTDFWADAPGGWVYEWSNLAAGYTRQQRPDLAALAYGAAKFPCLADAARRTAQDRQLEQYLQAAASFPVRFERRVLSLAGPQGQVDLPVHLYRSGGDDVPAPVLLFSGGVDTWKMDVHGWCIALAQHAGVVVLAFDMPGTGENPVLLGPDAADLVGQLVTVARSLGNGLVGHLGMSFGGNFSARTGLQGVVDAAVVLGGPVQSGFHPENIRRLPYGMADIVGNAMGLT